MITGYYYLHENGSLIYKVGTDCVADFRESDFVKAFWPFDPEDRETAWNLLVESLAAGANKDRVISLQKNGGARTRMPRITPIALSAVLAAWMIEVSWQSHPTPRGIMERGRPR